ncbi:beta family protein [Clostridium brassicae]|uniref:Beta family protein n=1 Tax=Clostridium brassicae TaxID=2999072 RepID=A0ABT4DCM4_9CLOT|nr:hypothetical protein [Clostridium brassicae]MCY6958891.1 hypothetical protein [Clostridium brassicae]
MYIPMMKTRREELQVSKKLNYCFSDKIIPLFEILNEVYEKKYEVDDNGKHLMELKPGNKRKTPILKAKTPDDIITLDKINEVVNESKVFIDYFRFDVDKYDRQLDIGKMTLAYMLNNNSDEYIKKLKGITKYKNMIPVLSLKKTFTFSKRQTIEIINELQSLNLSIAFRIEDDIYEAYKNIIEKYLRESDYLLYDINEQNFYSKIMELEDLRLCKTRAKKILLNSPRRLKGANKDYENCCKTSLIDNATANEYMLYDLDGFGDYGGLKDQLPVKDSGSNGKGAALALLYNYKDNSFYSFCNSDTSLGLRGYKDVITNILNYENILDQDNNCVAYIKIKSMDSHGKTGNWATWNNIALTRYIHQIYLKTKN